MVPSAMTLETLCALRREIARIEGEPPARLAGGRCAATHGRDAATLGDGGAGDAVVLREAGRAVPRRLKTGAPAFDAALGGGIPLGAVTEIVCADTRDAAAALGFAFGLASLLVQANAAGRPTLFVADPMSRREAGLPYGPALGSLFGLEAGMALFGHPACIEDTLRIAEEAAHSGALSCVIAEIRGNPAKLSLVSVQRLNRRAAAAGHPVLLLRQSAVAQPTAAPLRFMAASAPSGVREAFGEALAGSIGPPALSVTIDKFRAAPPATFLLEWNAHDRHFQEKPPAHSGRGAALPFDRPAAPPASWPPLAHDHDGHRRSA
jgi:protein ImuA